MLRQCSLEKPPPPCPADKGVKINWKIAVFVYLELHPTQLHTQGRDPVDVHLLLVRAAQDVEGLVHGLHLLLVVDRLNGDFAKTAERVVIDLKFVIITSFMAEILNLTHIVSEEARLVKVHNMSDQEVEDMVTSLTGIS